MARKITALLALALLVGLATAVPPKGLRLPWATAKKVSAGAATGTVTSIGEGVMMDFSANPITTTGTIAFDTAAFKLWWSASAGAWDTFKILAGWGLVKTASGDTVTLTGDSATIGTWGDARWLVVAYSDTIQLARDTANAALARRDTLTAGWGIDLASQPAGDDTVAIDSATVHTWGDGFWLGVGDTGAIDTTAFHHDSRADTSETLFARTVNIDTTAGPAALNVAGNAWVRDTIYTDTNGVFLLGNYSGGLGVYARMYQDVGIAIDAHYGSFYGTVYAFDSSAHVTAVSDSGAVDLSAVNSGGEYAAIALQNKHASTSARLTADSLKVARVIADTFVGDGSLLTGIAATDQPARDTAATALDTAQLAWASRVPPGTIIDWYGDSSAFPTGYVLCDGTRKFKTAAGDSMVTPDLRNFFTVGASIDTGNGIPMSSIEDTTGAVAKATGGSVKYTPAGTNSGVQPATHGTTAVNEGELDPVNVVDESNANHNSIAPDFTGTRAVLVQPYVAVWKLVRSRTW